LDGEEVFMIKRLAFSVLCMVSTLVFAEEEKVEKPVDISKVSEAFGHLIGKNLDSMGLKLDIAKVIKGLQDANEGRDSPMTELEYVEAVTSVQEAAFREATVENLKKADDFLAKNSKAENVKVIEPGKLQYLIEQEGTGSVVEEGCSPLIRYTGKFLDGTIFGASKEDELVNLDETIPGFSKGLLGMREGEKRMLYIHPDLGYGTSGYIPPNSLLMFEIEIVKANAPQTETIDSLSTSPSPHGNPEIAHPLQEQKAVR
jgi:peptidylprolyl isomerase